MIIIGLLIFIVQQRLHQKINIEKNKLLTSKNRKVENALNVKTELLNSITHELRTSLYAINTIAYMMKQIKSKDIDSTQVDILFFSGDHLLRFVNDVIDFNMGDNTINNNSLKFENSDLKQLLFKVK